MRMIIKAIVRVVIVLSAVRFLTYLASIPGGIAVESRYAAEPAGPWVYAAASAVAAVLWAGVLSVLWVKTDWIVRRIAGEIPDTELAVTTSNTELYSVILRAVGAYLIATSIPGLAGMVGRSLSIAISRPAYPFAYGTDMPVQVEAWVTGMVTLVVGLVLVTGNGGIAKAGRKVRDFLDFPPKPPSD